METRPARAIQDALAFAEQASRAFYDRHAFEFPVTPSALARWWSDVPTRRPWTCIAVSVPCGTCGWPSGPEGLRVQLFAQELKTLVLVSVKRLQKMGLAMQQQRCFIPITISNFK